MRITQTGDYNFCRWSRQSSDQPSGNIHHTSPLVFFQTGMADVRQRMLSGVPIQACGDCHHMEQHHKVSGRQRQLLKIGVRQDQFSKTMLTSGWLDQWQQDQSRGGSTDVTVQDWQIDLGSYCNSACVFCPPESSSRVAAEQLKLGLIQNLPVRAWTDSPHLVERFIQDLSVCTSVKYLHFIGGETLIAPSFTRILQAMIDRGLHEGLTLGFTTNLTVMRTDVIDLLERFQQINLGMSVECLDRANDYIRYGSEINQVQQNLRTWLEIGRDRGWFMQIRTTPSVLSVSKLVDIYDFAWQENLAVESCNFLDRPEFMRPAVLPPAYRQQALDRLRAWLASRDRPAGEQVINTRNPNLVHDQLMQDASSYVNYLEHEDDQSHRLPELARYLRMIDQHRGLSVIDHVPEYEELFRSAGY